MDGHTPRFERRRRPRRQPRPGEPIARARVRAGWELAVVEISSAGALVEGVARLLPGTHLDVHLTTADGRVLVRSRVIRAWVCALAAEEVRYRGALAFDREVQTSPAGYPVPASPIETPPYSGIVYPTVPPAAEAY